MLKFRQAKRKLWFFNVSAQLGKKNLINDKIIEQFQNFNYFARKVAGSSPDEVIGFFNLPNPSSCTMALGSTQPLTDMSTRNLPGGG
jgi:hypothetical protein